MQGFRSLIQVNFLLIWLVLSAIFAFVAPIISEIWEYRSYTQDVEYLQAHSSATSLATNIVTPSARNVVVPLRETDNKIPETLDLAPSEPRKRISFFDNNASKA